MIKRRTEQFNGREGAGSDFHLALSVTLCLRVIGFAPRNLNRYILSLK